MSSSDGVALLRKRSAQDKACRIRTCSDGASDLSRCLPPLRLSRRLRLATASEPAQADAAARRQLLDLEKSDATATRTNGKQPWQASATPRFSEAGSSAALVPRAQLGSNSKTGELAAAWKSTVARTHPGWRPTTLVIVSVSASALPRTVVISAATMRPDHIIVAVRRASRCTRVSDRFEMSMAFSSGHSATPSRRAQAATRVADPLHRRSTATCGRDRL